LTILRALLDPPQPLTIDTHEVAIGVAREYGFGFYDALIVAAALRAGCPMLYSEDLHAGQVIERLTIHNPFR
jgi:predicted nucleic acid-binding protein